MGFDDVMHVKCLAQHQVHRKEPITIGRHCVGGQEREGGSMTHKGMSLGHSTVQPGAVVASVSPTLRGTQGRI